MPWVWQQKDWPTFNYDNYAFEGAEKGFLKNAGRLTGSIAHLDLEQKDVLRVELLSAEALSTSGIEGEILNRDSVQSSIRRHLQLKTDFRKVKANEAGIAEMMVDLYLHFDKPLHHDILFEWHRMLLNGRRDIEIIGAYRSHEDPMQIVSGNISKPKVYYEAPPSSRMQDEMKRFMDWYHSTLSNRNLPTVVFAGLVHLYFEMIHPFEDGNGRIGRALAEKAVSQRLSAPSLNSLAKVIELHKKEFYKRLNDCNTTLHIQSYLELFSKLLLESQEYTYRMVLHLIAKTQFLQKHSHLLNARQLKVILRIWEEGPDGFKGGLNAQKYTSITGAPSATVTRDLRELVDLGVMKREGELKGTRYWMHNHY